MAAKKAAAGPGQPMSGFIRSTQQEGADEPMERSDEELMAAYQQGEEQALAELVRRYADRLLGYLFRVLHDRQQAEDVFQETFLRVHRKAASFRTGKRFKPWVFAIASNLAIDTLRRSRGRQLVSLENGGEDALPLGARLADPGPDPATEAEGAERRALVRRAVETLPPRQRATLMLTYFEDMTYPEAARVLGCTVGTIKKQMSRALATLSRLLPDPGEAANAGGAP